MIIEARAAGCFTSTFVLKLDGRAIGKFEGRWFGESLDIALTGRRQLVFQKLGWMSSEFVLKRDEPEAYMGHADRGGIFTSKWNLDLSIGAAELVKEGWFGSAYHIQQGERIVGRVDRIGWCERGWMVESQAGLKEEDLILVGLVYHTVLRRQQQAAHHGGAAGS